VQHDSRPQALCLKRIPRLLHATCSRAEAVRILRELASGAALTRFLARRPYHRVGPALAARIRDLGIGDDEPDLRRDLAALDRLAAACELRSRLLRAQLSEAVSLLGERGIPVCLIKGAVSLADEAPVGCLPASVRPMEDLDIVVPPEHGEAAFELIAGRGWLCTSGAQPVRFSPDAPAFVDVRAWVPRTPALGFLELDDFFTNAAGVTVGGRAVRALRPEDALQLRLAHNVIRQHLFVDFPLLDLHEMAATVAARRDAIDWARLRGVGLMNEVAPILYAVLLRLRDEFGAPVPDGVIPAVQRRPARRMRRLLDELAAVPSRLYPAASRVALMRAVGGRLRDKLGRACTVLFSDPLRLEKRRPPAARIRLPLRTMLAHLAVCAWRMLRG